MINTGYRMVYPLLPTFARGLGVDATAIAQAITARSSLGLLGPLFGSVADHRGRRFAMLFGLGMLFVGLLRRHHQTLILLPRQAPGRHLSLIRLVISSHHPQAIPHRTL